MSKPSIILVPASFTRPELYDVIMKPLIQQGWEARALHSPSIGVAPDQGREGPAPTMYDDAAFIANEVGKLADEGKDVVLFAHSYGGLPATESIKKLSKVPSAA